MSKILMNEVWEARDQRDSAQAEVRRLKEANAELIAALKAMIAANDGVAVMPTPKARRQNIALEQAKATISKTEGGSSEQ